MQTKIVHKSSQTPGNNLRYHSNQHNVAWTQTEEKKNEQRILIN